MGLFSKEFWQQVKNNNTYRGKVREVLMSREAANINFTAYGIQISGTIFPTVANDFTGEKPTRYVVVKKEVYGGAGAVYDRSTNTMEVEFDEINSRIWKGYVVHEAVHAWIDRNKLKPLMVDNEAVSYIAQAIYYRRVGLSRSRLDNPVYLAARDIGNLLIKGGTPSDTSLQNLRSQILARPAYSHLTAATVDTSNDG
jgi:hypothetical protein